MFLSKHITFYKTAFRNWWVPMIKRVFSKYPITVILNNFNINVTVNNKRQFYMAGYFGNHSLPLRKDFNFEWDEKLNEMHVLYKNKKMVMKHIFEDGDFAGVFIAEEYSEIDFNNRLVIDIGASICDTALYFTLKGAKKIIAFEPVPKVFKMGLDNIVSNNLEKTIVYKNEAVGDKRRLLRIDDGDFIAGGSALRMRQNGIEIKQVTLTSILNSPEVNSNGAILKLDCEGCEYALFSEVDTNSLKKLDIIIIEYHNGLQYIPSLLKNHGFKLQKIKPKIDDVGLLIAKRDGSF